MTIIKFIGIALVLIWIVLIVWYAICIHITSIQRQKIMIAAVMSSGLMADIARVKFDRHFWRVFFFKDHRRLYSGATWRANGWSRK